MEFKLTLGEAVDIYMNKLSDYKLINKYLENKFTLKEAFYRYLTISDNDFLTNYCKGILKGKEDYLGYDDEFDPCNYDISSSYDTEDEWYLEHYGTTKSDIDDMFYDKDYPRDD